LDVEQLADRLASWIRERAEAAGSLGTVMGISGGIDSSVGIVLCQRAFPKTTLGLMLPCHSDPQDEEHARLVAEQFGISAERVPLDGVFDSLCAVIPGDGGPSDAGRSALANIKARLRMTCVYYSANRLGYVVVGSGNRSELATAYFTKYGDGGVDIAPLGNLVKTQVRELARFLGIPQAIIDKPPSAGLWQGQTDEAEMGLTYDDLDRYLLTGEAAPDVRRRIEGLGAAGRHKLNPPLLPDF
jgi:NAD+ synthase